MRIALLYALLALVWAGAALAGDTPTDDDVRSARRLTAEGAKALSAGRLERATERFAEALERVPESVEAKQNLALAHARLGAEALRREDGGVAFEHLDRALLLHPDRIRYQVDRGRALLLLGRDGEALRIAQAATTTSPEMLEAWLLLADVDERRGELAEAVEALERAIQVARPRARGELGQRLLELSKRAKTEAAFLTHATGNFVARYGPDADPGTVRLALTILEDAYSRVTANLATAPKTPARVVLYEGGEFQEVTGAHGWVGALYIAGTLRVPIRNLQSHKEVAERILSHEFTHHVLRQTAPGLPTWWHEGIAQHEEIKTASKERQFEHLTREMRRLRDAGSLLTLERMQKTHVANVSDVNFVTLYYAQARSFVDYLVEQYGSGALPSFLVALGTGRDTSAACEAAFGRTEAQLWEAWKASL
ncbi:MAG: tetratricopeptide repeat protein [Planctomycetota bacterium]|nr:tetratricopeptide repeat protein [Planctomycetota bacterium]